MHPARVFWSCQKAEAQRGVKGDVARVQARWHAPWRPARAIPAQRRSKAKRLLEILRKLAERETDARSMLKANPSPIGGLARRDV
jgi:hypothetical protein